MQRNGNALFDQRVLGLAVSGQRYTYRGGVYRCLRANLPRLYANSPTVEFVFIDVLRGIQLSCPLLWTEEWGEDPLSRLLVDWSNMVRYMRKVIDDQIIPKVQQGKTVVVIFHGFGLNLLLHAAVTSDFNLRSKVIDQVFKAHGGLVETFFDHFTPPEYIITKADTEAVSARMAQESTLLAAINPLIRTKFIQFEEAAIDQYESRVPMQKPFHFIKASFTEDEMCREGLNIVKNRVGQFLKTAAAA